MQSQLVFAEDDPSALTNFYTRNARLMDSGLEDFYMVFPGIEIIVKWI